MKKRVKLTLLLLHPFGIWTPLLSSNPRLKQLYVMRKVIQLSSPILKKKNNVLNNKIFWNIFRFRNNFQFRAEYSALRIMWNINFWKCGANLEKGSLDLLAGAPLYMKTWGHVFNWLWEMSDFTMGTNLVKGFAQAQVHAVSMVNRSYILWKRAV